MKYSILFASIIIFLNFSCSSEQSKKLASTDSLIISVFSEKHACNLDLILVFFDNHVKEFSKNQKIEEAYRKFIYEVSNVRSGQEHIDKTQLHQNNLDLIISKLESKNCFKTIWVYEYGYDYNTKDALSVFLNLNFEGNYVYLLKEMSKENKYLKNYLERITNLGAITPKTIALFHEYANHFNLNDPKYRLICAIHYITVAYRKDFNT